MPQDALVIGYGRPDGYSAIDFIELFENKDIRTDLLRKMKNQDPAICNHEGNFVYLDCMFNLFP